MPKDPTRVAAGRKSKRKGNSNERVIAKLLREWWGTGEFIRTPSSGGWGRSPAFREGFNASGDISTTNADFPWVVEVKSQEYPGFEPLIDGESPILLKFWDQAVSETGPGKQTLLLFTRKFRPWYAMFENEIVAKELQLKGTPILCLTTPKQPRPLTITLLSSLTAIPKSRILELLALPKE